jgi:hypothetical protein
MSSDGVDSMAYKYEVALSFAGEDRAFAEAVATALRQEDIDVFYNNVFHLRIVGRRSVCEAAQYLLC